jgi:hypothetical protein
MLSQEEPASSRLLGLHEHKSQDQFLWPGYQDTAQLSVGQTTQMAANLPSTLKPLIFHASVEGRVCEGVDADLPQEAYMALRGEAEEASSLSYMSLLPQQHALEQATMDGAVDVIEARRERYRRSRGMPWPPRMRPASARAGAGTEPLPEAAAVVIADDEQVDVQGGGKSSGRPAGPLMPLLTRPKPGQELELTCQSLAFGGKVGCARHCSCTWLVMLARPTFRALGAPMHDSTLSLELYLALD